VIKKFVTAFFLEIAANHRPRLRLFFISLSLRLSHVKVYLTSGSNCYDVYEPSDSNNLKKLSASLRATVASAGLT
jgi:hypothetical protein